MTEHKSPHEPSTYADYFRAPRWSHPGKAIRDRVWGDPDIELVDIQEEKTLLRTTVRFVVHGPRFALEKFRDDLHTAISEYNG